MPECLSDIKIRCPAPCLQVRRRAAEKLHDAIAILARAIMATPSRGIMGEFHEPTRCDDRASTRPEVGIRRHAKGESRAPGAAGPEESHSKSGLRNIAPWPAWAATDVHKCARPQLGRALPHTWGCLARSAQRPEQTKVPLQTSHLCMQGAVRAGAFNFAASRPILKSGSRSHGKEFRTGAPSEYWTPLRTESERAVRRASAHTTDEDARLERRGGRARADGPMMRRSALCGP